MSDQSFFYNYTKVLGQLEMVFASCLQLISILKIGIALYFTNSAPYNIVMDKTLKAGKLSQFASLKYSQSLTIS